MATATLVARTPGRSRLGVAGALLAALALIVSGLIQLALVHPQRGPGELGSASATLIESAHAVAWAGMILAFVEMRARHGQRFGRLGTLAFYLSVIGLGALIAITAGVLIAYHIAGSAVIFDEGTLGETIANFAALPGFLALLLWTPLLGIAVWRGGVLPWWCALLLIAHPLLVTFLIASYGFGGLALGALWLAAAMALRPRAVSLAARAPSP